MSTRPSPITALPALLVVVVSLWEVCATRRDANAVPSDDAWDAAANVVREGYHAGDLIVFAPEWVDPVGRLHLGDLIPIDMAARMDAARYGRIWEVAIRGAHSPDIGDLKPAEETDHDGVVVRRYERPAVTVVSDIREQLATIRAGPRPTLELAEVGFQPHRCLQITPAPNHPVRITFAQLALGTELVGYVGLADVFTRRDVRVPGHLDVEIGGKVVASAAPGVDDGWVRFSTPTMPGPADVTFIASAEAGGRLICFAAEARR